MVCPQQEMVRVLGEQSPDITDLNWKTGLLQLLCIGEQHI